MNRLGRGHTVVGCFFFFCFFFVFFFFGGGGVVVCLVFFLIVEIHNTSTFLIFFENFPHFVHFQYWTFFLIFFSVARSFLLMLLHSLWFYLCFVALLWKSLIFSHSYFRSLLFRLSDFQLSLGGAGTPWLSLYFCWDSILLLSLKRYVTFTFSSSPKFNIAILKGNYSIVFLVEISFVSSQDIRADALANERALHLLSTEIIAIFT